MIQGNGSGLVDPHIVEALRRIIWEVTEAWALEIADRRLADGEKEGAIGEVISTAPAAVSCLLSVISADAPKASLANVIRADAESFAQSRYRLGWSAGTVVEDLSDLYRRVWRWLELAAGDPLGGEARERGDRLMGSVISMAVDAYHAAVAADGAYDSLDALCCLPNRAVFERRLRGEVTRSERYGAALAMLLCDLDSFHALNKEFGRLLGNDVLKLVGEGIRRQLRGSDTLSRLRADDFALLMPNTSAGEALSVALRLRKSLSQLRLPVDWELKASIGISFLPDACMYPAQALERRSLEAMLAARASGGDTIVLG